MKLHTLFSISTLFLVSTTSFSANLFPNGIVSDWNAIHSQGTTVNDSMGINTGTLNNVLVQSDGNGEIFSFNAPGNNISILNNASLNPTTAFAVNSWIKVDNTTAVGNQTLISKLQRNSIMSPSDLINYDATDATGPSYARGNFQKTVFDGRYVYSVSLPASGNASVFLRYDTRTNFTDSTSWSSFSMYKLKKPNDIHWYSGYNSLVFDGRYIYLVPYYYQYEPGSFHGFTLRYDTQGPLSEASSWASYDIRSLDGANDLVKFRDGAFDGKYIYYVGGGNKQASGQKVARYDTALQFDNAASWSNISLKTLLPYVGTTTYLTTVLADKYLYFIPSANSGLFLRYDTRKPFNDAASWISFNAANTNGTNVSINYAGGTFDGRYLYFSPNYQYSESMLRYDTAMNFTDQSAWSAYSVKEPTSSGKFRQKGYAGAGFDGRYVYYFPNAYKEIIIPRVENRIGGRILRYDTTQPYSANTSWTQLDFNTLYGNYGGAAFDQRYFYISSINPSSFRANIYRLDTAANNNFAFTLNRSNFSSDINSAASFGPNFSISTSNGYYSLFTNSALTNGWHLLTGTYDGSAMSLYVDNNLVGSRVASGALNTSSANLLIGSSYNNSFSYSGMLNKAEFFNRALTLADIQQVYRLSPYGGCGLKNASGRC